MLVIPLIGVLVYLIVRGSSMQERSVQQAQQQDRELRAYVQEAAGTPTSTADQLAKLADLRDRGVITPEEFEREKAKTWPERGPQSAGSLSILWGSPQTRPHIRVLDSSSGGPRPDRFRLGQRP